MGAFIRISVSTTSSCPRKIMYDKLHLPVELSEYIKRRMFDGNLHEESILAESYEKLNLRKLTVTEIPKSLREYVNVDANGNINFEQFKMVMTHPEDPDIEFVGKIDDLAAKVDTGEPVLLEAKAVGQNTWIKLITKGVQEATPYYYEQVQMYLYMLNSLGIPVTYGYLVVRNVDTKGRMYDFRWFRINADYNVVKNILDRFKALKPAYTKITGAAMLDTETAIEEIKQLQVPFADPDLPPCELCIYRDYCYPPVQTEEDVDENQVKFIVERIKQLETEVALTKQKMKEIDELKKQLKELLPDKYEKEFEDIGVKVKVTTSVKPNYKWRDILESLDSEFLKQFATTKTTKYLRISYK